MEIRQLKYFLAVAESLHFHHAADKLHLAQPSLSQQINQLEQQLGVKLFDRTNRRVTLTAAGMALVPRARQVLLDISAAIQDVQRTEQGIAGKLTIGFISSAMAGALPRALRTFQSQVPDVTIELQECSPEEQIQMLLNNSIDIAFVHTHLEDEGLSTLIVQRDSLIIALSEDIAPEGPSVNLCDYAQYASIMPAPFKSAGLYEHIQRAYHEAGTMPSKVLFTNLIIGGINSVSSGIGIALVPSIFRDVKIPGVTYRNLDQVLPPIELSAVWRSTSIPRQLQRFIDILRQQNI